MQSTNKINVKAMLILSNDTIVCLSHDALIFGTIGKQAMIETIKRKINIGDAIEPSEILAACDVFMLNILMI